MLSNELQEFLKKQFPYEAKFTPEMKLFRNFGLENDEIEGFLEIFAKRFNVKISENFSIEERFGIDEEGTLLEAIWSWIFLIPNLICWIIGWHKSEKFKDLSFEELDEAIKKGILE